MTSISKKIEIYSEILGKYCGDGVMEWMSSPFLSDGKVISTNGIILIAVPNIFSNEWQDFTDKTQAVYPFDRNENILVSLDRLKSALSKVELVDVYDKIQTPCEACDVEGVVDYEFEFNGEVYTTQYDCPVCDGAGVREETLKTPSEKREFSNDSYIEIENHFFAPKYIEAIIWIAELLNEQNIFIVRKTANSMMAFSISEIEVILMPCNISNLNNIKKISE